MSIFSFDNSPMSFIILFLSFNYWFINRPPGLGVGLDFLVLYVGFALGFWFGTFFALDSPQFGDEKFLRVFFGVISGAVAVWQAMPRIADINAAKTAAFKVCDQPSTSANSSIVAVPFHWYTVFLEERSKHVNMLELILHRSSLQLFKISKLNHNVMKGCANQISTEDDSDPHSKRDAILCSQSRDGEATPPTFSSFSSVALIEFRNVSFFYPQNPNRWVLRHFNLRIFPGATVALLGSSGCGKTTVLELLLRWDSIHYRHF